MERRSVAIDDGPKSLRDVKKRPGRFKRNGYAEVEEDVASQIIDMEKKNLIGKAAEPIKTLISVRRIFLKSCYQNTST